MSDLSPVLALPFIMPAQAQKHVTHNEALRILDVLVQTVVLDRTLTVPPSLPQPGDRHIVAAGGTGAWAGQDDRIAVFEAETWAFHAPQPGWSAHVLAENGTVTYTGTGWAASADKALRVAQLGVSAGPDATNRLSVSSPATLLSHAGAGHQLKINKAAASDTASLLYQTGYSARAEMGTAGNDDFSIKVSPNGSAFYTGLTLAAATGKVTLPAGVLVVEGTAVAPSISFSASPATGLFQPASNQIGLATNGVTRATISTTALTIDLPVSGTAVTQSATDTTAGRLTKVGDFGLGATTGLSAALNSATMPGFYSYVSTDAARPNASASGGSFLVSKHGTSWVRQIAFVAAATNCWHRYTADGGTTWSAWREFYTGPIVGSVAQSGGVPTGAIVERGSNANGEYVRFADGTQICWRTFTEDVAVATAHPTGGFRDLGRTWSFPAAFTAAPSVTATSGSTAASGAFVVNAAGSACSVFCTAVTSQATVATRVINCQAIGRWF